MSECENSRCIEVRAILDRLLAERNGWPVDDDDGLVSTDTPDVVEQLECRPWLFRWRERPLPRRTR